MTYCRRRRTSYVFVGHGMLAFALVGTAAVLAGVEEDRALALALAAAVFATIPDVDILYALTGLVGTGLLGPWTSVEAFWTTGNVVHRAVTHSMLLAVPATAGFALATTRRGRPASVGVLGGVVAWVLLAGDALVGVIAVAWLLTGVGVAVVASRRFGLGPRAVLATAAAGLLTHPLGDLFTGEPPAVLYPLDVTVFPARVTLHADPTLHLLAAFGLELATIWLAAATYVRLRGGQFLPNVDRRAALGATYGVAAIALPAPTLEVSYHFVFSVLAVGAVGLLAGRHPVAVADDRPRAVLTGLTAVTVAGLAYALTYLLV